MNHLPLNDALIQLNEIPAYIVRGLTKSKNTPDQDGYSVQTLIFFGPPDFFPENLLQFLDFKIYECTPSSKTTKEWQSQCQQKIEIERKNLDEFCRKDSLS